MKNDKTQPHPQPLSEREGWKKRLGIWGLLGLPLMAWTTPAAFDNGTVPTAADFDTITDDLTHIGDMTFWGKSLKNYNASSELGMRLLGSDTDSTDRTTTSTSFADISGLSVTCNTNGGLVVVVFRAPFKAVGGSVSEFHLTLKYDSTTIESTDGLGRYIVNASNEESILLVHPITGLSAGSHTFVPRWKTVASSTVTMGASSVHDAALYVLGG